MKSKRSSSFRHSVLAISAMAALSAAGPATAVPLLSGLGGAFGYGDLAMSPNDDGSSSRLNLPFSINFFGQTYNSFFVNNNGNVTFNSTLSTFTPEAFPVSNQPMIAPWWADVDTRGGSTGQPGSNNVYVAAPNADTVVVTWNDVGYYSRHNERINDFQLVLRNRSDTGAGNFDIDFRYEVLQWTTGDASGGISGLGGVPAQAGYDSGQGLNGVYFTLPGSQTNDVLDLVNTSNVAQDQPGLWTFAVRNGQTPGSVPSNPLMPVVVDGSFQFDFNVQLNQRIFIDPVVAVGYNYALNDSTSPNFASAVLPTGIGDDLYDLWLWNGLDYEDSGIDIAGGTPFVFGPGVRQFSIRGIETSANLDPSDTNAFVTGLTFDGTGRVNMSMTPLTQDTGGGSVPEPASSMLVIGALALMGRRILRRDRIHRQPA